MARKHRKVQGSGGRVLLVDDDPDYLEATRLLLESEGHAVSCAENGAQALRLLREQPVDLLLLDYFMPVMTGDEVVTRLREFDPYVQVVLQTGYSDEQPPREMLRKLDIQGYYDKSEGPEKLLLWTDAGLKSAAVIQRVRRSRQGLGFVLDAAPGLHKVQPVSDLLEKVLQQALELCRLLDQPRSEGTPAAASVEHAFIAVLREDAELGIQASAGRYVGCVSPNNVLEPPQASLLVESMRSGQVQSTEVATVLPLRVGEATLGVLFLELAAASAETLELLRLYTQQATLALHNMQLYSVAALDPLTGVHGRRFCEQWLRREIRTAFRARKPLCVILVDVDGMRRINDSAGHLVGDQALVLIGQALRASVRENDLVGRHGGDEFVIVLPETAAPRAEKIAWRIIAALEPRRVPGPEAAPLRCSLGVVELGPHSFHAESLRKAIPTAYFQQVASQLLERTVEALGRAQSHGGGQLYVGPPVVWPSP